MKNEFILAFNEVIEEKQLSREIILQALESAMAHAYRRSVNASTAQLVEAQVDPETGKVTIHAEKEVVDSVQDDRTEVNIEDAKEVDPEAEIGGMVIVECTPSDFGRVAAQTARQVIQQRIRDAERQAQLDHYSKQLGEIISGIVQAASSQGLTIGLELRAEGMLLRKEMIPGERFRIHDRVRTLVAEVKDSNKGPQIILSRTHRDFLRRLLENEVPEIYHGIVEIRSIAREPGQRAKVAVSATQAGIDPVGACVGIRGVRIQAIVRELHDEKIDVIEWNPDPVAFIAKAISPARVIGVYLSERTNKTATVVVPEDQLSLAIGRDGQNARLAAKLTGWRIDIKSLSEAAADAVNRLQSDEMLEEIAQSEAQTTDQVSEMLAKRAEGRPLTPEEYDIMAHFTDRVEKKVAIQLKPEPIPETKSIEVEIGETIPNEYMNQNLLDSEIREHVANILQEAGYKTTGQLIIQMKIDPDVIFRLQGIGPKAMESIDALANKVLTKPEEENVLELASAEETEIIDQVIEDLKDEEVEVKVEESAPGEEIPTIELEPDSEDTIQETIIEDSEIKEEIAVQPEQIDIAEEPVKDLAVGDEGDLSFEELFKLKPTIMGQVYVDEEEETGAKDTTAKKKKKKKKRKFTEIEYDPDQDLTVVRKKRKRGDDDSWNLDI